MSGDIEKFKVSLASFVCENIEKDKLSLVRTVCQCGEIEKKTFSSLSYLCVETLEIQIFS